MPELPDIVVYLEALAPRILHRRVTDIRIASPFLLRSVEPPIAAACGRAVSGLQRIGKRIVLELEDDLFLVLHLMIAGRLRWKPPGAAIPRRMGLAGFDFSGGTLLLTEAGTRKRAALHLVQGREALAEFHRGGIEPLEAAPEAFARALLRENHTLKRALTDPRIFSGIGNAYSDEILHRAALSPLRLTRRLTPEEIERLRLATRQTLEEWTDRLRREVGEGFPGKVTAFREGMAVHGRFGLPCPTCGAPVQRIRYAENETNYCARCQNEGRLLADRALSRLLREDWPGTLEELERVREGTSRGSQEVD
ncbi:MAG: Fpg/Nei family DNA glycosylase [Gemmatimonadales bacterium]